MADNKIGHALASTGSLDAIDTTQRNPLGYRQLTDDGNEFIYLAGIAAVAANVAIVYNATTYVSKILTAADVGAVAIARQAILAINWGWFLIKGFGSASSDTVAAAGGLFIDGTPGRVDDASVAGDMIYGMVSTGASVAGVCPVHLNYPMVTHTVPA